MPSVKTPKDEICRASVLGNQNASTCHPARPKLHGDRSSFVRELAIYVSSSGCWLISLIILQLTGNLVSKWASWVLWAAAAAAKLLQSCLTLCDHIDRRPPGSSVPGILQARILEWVAISFSNACMHAESLQLCPTLGDPMDSRPPGSSVHGTPRQEFWNGLPFPSPSVSCSNKLIESKRGVMGTSDL